MADQEVTNAELGRRIDAFSKSVHEDLAELRQQLTQYVLREVYQAEKRASDDRIAGLQKRLDDAEERRRADRRWLIGTVTLPIAFVVADIAMKLGGAG